VLVPSYPSARQPRYRAVQRADRSASAPRRHRACLLPLLAAWPANCTETEWFESSTPPFANPRNYAQTSNSCEHTRTPGPTCRPRLRPARHQPRRPGWTKSSSQKTAPCRFLSRFPSYAETTLSSAGPQGTGHVSTVSLMVSR